MSGAFSVLKRLGDALHRLWLFYLVIITLCIIGEPGAQGTVWPATQSRILGSPDEGASMPTPSLPSSHLDPFSGGIVALLTHRLQLSTVPALVVTLSNAYGLFVITAGPWPCGEVPRTLWRALPSLSHAWWHYHR